MHSALRSAALFAAILAGAPATASAQDAGSAADEWERDVAVLGPGADTATTMIVDALTGEPIEGARLTWYAEMEGLRAPALGTSTTGRYGLASLDWTAVATWNADSHFVADADGYATGYAWGEFPPAVIELHELRTIRTRIVDQLGHPVADAPVEFFVGCGHGPVVRMLRTDADGELDVEFHSSSEARLWVETPTVEADYLELGDAHGLGARIRTLTLAPGGVASGLVLDPAGRPLEGVEVRSFQRYRGPIGLTDKTGRFELLGIAADAALYFMHPNALEGSVMLEGDEWRCGTPLTLSLAPWGFASESTPREPVLVRVLGRDGRAADDPGLVLVRESDGRAFDRDWAAENLPPGVVRFEVPPGLYVARAESAFSEYDIEELPIDVRPGAPLRVNVRGERRATLQIEGNLPEDVSWTVAVEGAAGEDTESFLGDDPEAFVPLADTLVVGATRLGRTWFFDAPPAENGVRRVRAELPAPHRIRVAAPEGADVALFHGDIPCVIAVSDDGLLTYATGELRVVVEDEGRRSRVPVVLPEGAPVERSVAAADIDAHRQTGVLRIAVRDSAASRAHLDIRRTDGLREAIDHDDVDVTIATEGGGIVEATRADHVPVRRAFDGPGDMEIAWGSAALTLRVTDDDGDYVPVTVIVDGRRVPPRAPDDVTLIRVLGLQPGAHTVVVAPQDDAFLGKEMRIVLSENETRRKRLTLAWRD